MLIREILWRQRKTITSCSETMTFHQSCEVSLLWNNQGKFVLEQSRNRIPDKWCIIHAFLLISTPDIRLTLLFQKQPHIFAKSAVFYRAMFVSTHLTHFMPRVLSIPPENIRKPWFSDVFRGYRKRPMAWNGLREPTSVLIFWNYI